MYVDETGFDAPLIREYAYSDKGQPIGGECTGKRFARTSLIAALKEGQSIAPMEFRGYCDTQVVLSWVEQMLIPSLKPGDVVIWDNATFHKSSKLTEALAAAGIGLLFLPPYSPDLNPIEMAFSKLKAHLRRIGARTIEDLWKAIGDICGLYTPEECWNYFAKAGYASD